MSSPITNTSDIISSIRLEKQIEKTNQHLCTVSQKLETLEIENNNKREIRKRTLTKWRNSDEKYISTSATQFILKSLNHNKGVIITGSPGCGKSVAAHHVALIFDKEGYEVVPCDDSSEIFKHFRKDKTQVFVIDDICGRFALNKHKADFLEQNDGKLSILFDSNNHNDDDYEDNLSKSETKFLITCRENIYSHKAFPNLTCLSLVQCSFSTKYKISPDEMRKIALSYISENIVNNIDNICLYDFFPLLCALYDTKANRDLKFFIHPVEIIENEISEMKIKSESSFLCLSLLVLRNNSISKDDLISCDVEQLVEAICRDTEIESVVSMVSIQKCFERFKGIYIIEAEEIYTAIHDKMFDTISAAIAPSMMKCFIKNADIRLLANRIQLLSLGRSSLPFVVYIPQELERTHFNRQFKEAMKGKYWEVFGSIQAENEAYRKQLLSYLKEQDGCQQMSYVPGKDGATPLFVSSSLGYIDFVEYFIVKCRLHIDIKDKEGRSPFFVACENGHIAVVKHLMKYYKDINTKNAAKTTILSATCLNGHKEVAQLLLDNKADISIANELNQNTFHFACLHGDAQLVGLLLSAYEVDRTFRITDEKTDLQKASQKGLTQNNNKFRKLCRDVNQKSNIQGRTPLHLACQKGHYETVKLLLDFNVKLNGCVDTNNVCQHGWSVLHVACYKGYNEIVKLLVDVGINVNDTTNEGLTPLFLASCQKGHKNTVKFLLSLNDQTLERRVDIKTKHKDRWSHLHTACFNGHTDVVKLLLEIGMNINDTTNNGSTPLHLACQAGHNDTVKFLLSLNDQTLERRVDITTKDKDRWSHLHTACFNGHTDVVKLLLEIACFNGHTEVVKLLLDIGMNINDTTNKGSTPLHLACQRGHNDTVKALFSLNDQTLSSHVDTTVKNKNGWSVIHSACFNGHTEVVKLLSIDVGLNVNDTSNGGCTPLYLSCKAGHFDTAKYLLNLNDITFYSHVETLVDKTNRQSALHAAYSNGHTKVVKLLNNVGINEKETRNMKHSCMIM
ncbi:Hypothetical predicted protein [Mytilus galloprovincialis]|uniref:Novel STAND NTPase 3 domain-containing protein n=1 Tax=Mytilus galloprovincialis TaxID=29158 RepID=A0A8B6EYZ3_MYTGA|nr:Hypothetical predicted protein [Mytilus galloprovincialis]